MQNKVMAKDNDEGHYLVIIGEFFCFGRAFEIQFKFGESSALIDES
jgi:hypothetical protein